MIVKNVVDPSLVYLSEKFDVDETLLLDMSVIVEDEDGSIAWLIECPDVLQAYSRSNGFDFFKTMHHRLETKTNKFKTLITSDPSFAKYDCVHLTKPCLPSWISDDNSKLYQKSKLITNITSAKMFTPMQIERKHFADYMIEKGYPVFGRGFTEVDDKLDILQDFMFCVVIENGVHQNCHTEKILDCFRTGTVPIYLGDPNICDHFDCDGIIQVSSVEEMAKAIETVSEEQYQSMTPALHRNLELAVNYKNSPEDILEEFLNTHK